MGEFSERILRFVLNFLVGVGVAFEFFRQIVLIHKVQLLKVLLLNLFVSKHVEKSLLLQIDAYTVNLDVFSCNRLVLRRFQYQ
jgi:hypothetical protein